MAANSCWNCCSSKAADRPEYLDTGNQLTLFSTLVVRIWAFLLTEKSLSALFILLVGLIILSGFFSSSETGMMSLNRYRLKHMAKTGHKGARRAQRLLNRTDQLIGVILIGNNFVNIFASAIATVIAIR